MARTKKSEIAAQDEQNQIPGSELAETDTSNLYTEDGGVTEEQDAAELAAPSDGEDAPLFLPDVVDESSESEEGGEAAGSGDSVEDDWPPEEMSPLQEDADAAETSDADGEVLDASVPDAEAESDSADPLLGNMAESLMSSGMAESAAEDTTPAPKKASAPRKRAASTAKPAAKPAAKPRRQAAAPVLTIDKRTEVETAATREEILWHEIQNAARTKRILTGTLGGIEKLENGKSIAVVYYKELRVIIPTTEMMLHLGGDNPGYGTMTERENKILGNMLGCEIDFVLKGIDSRTRSAVGSRREAMLRKRKTFYLDPDAATGQPRIHEGRVVQARVIAVASKVVRVEAFGVEVSIMARDMSWEWIGDAHERFHVGDRLLVRINKIRAENIEEISIQADARSMTANTVAENLQKCRAQGKYAGVVTDIHKGVVFIRLSIGVNAIAHSCLDSRMPAKQDEVSFVVTHIDSEQGVAMGLITRIIKQKI